MEDAVRQVKREIMDVCFRAQKNLGGDSPAVVCVLNAVMHATAEYAVGSTTTDAEEGVKRFNALGMKLAKVLQDFIAEHTGGAAIIELPEGP
jgi:hypothetical protein